MGNKAILIGGLIGLFIVGILMLFLPKILGTEGPNGDGLPEVLQALSILFFLPLIVLILILIFFKWIINTKSQMMAILVGILIALIYASIPAYSVVTGSGSGDPGPYGVFMIPFFYPVGFTFLLVVSLVGLFVGGNNLHLVQDIPIFVNVIVWGLMGGFIGWKLSKRVKGVVVQLKKK